jgi:hypothetical protein
MWQGALLSSRFLTTFHACYCTFIPRRMLRAMGPSQREKRWRGSRVIDDDRCSQQSQEATSVCSIRW